MTYNLDAFSELLGTRRFVSVKTLEPGMVIQFTYDGAQRHAIVLNPDFGGKLHAISIAHIGPLKFIDLLRDIHGMDDPMQIHEKITNSQYVENRPYRTFLHRKMHNIRNIHLKVDIV
jgi:hypothetical protein